MSIAHHRSRIAIVGLVLLFPSSGDALAQDPIYVPAAPEWQVDASSNSMVLAPTSSKLALGLPAGQKSTLQVMGENISSEPGVGYIVLGSSESLHMQLDRNDIRVSGPTNSTFGALYLQRYGGPIVVHGSQAIKNRFYVTSNGDIGVATSDPRQFAIDRKLIGPGWTVPNGAVAVDGDVYADRLSGSELRVLDLVQIGRPTNPSMSGASRDYQHPDALLQVGGKVSAQSVVVHLDTWADDVFDEDYDLLPLSELADFIERERHLPEVPREAEALSEGLDVAKSNELLLRKVEELTLYTLAQHAKIEELERKIDALSK